MNELKKPQSLAAGTNLILTIGSVAYLYKQNELLKDEVTALKNDLRSLTTKLQKFTNDDIQTEEVLKVLHKDVKQLKTQFNKLDVEEELLAIKYALTDNDIEVKSPVKTKPPKKKKYRLSSEEETSESIETPKKKPQKKKIEDEDLISLYRSKANK